MTSIEHEIEDPAVAKQLRELTEVELWQRALGAKPPPSTWRVYHTGEPHNGLTSVAQATRELMRRKLAFLSQRRAKGREGFEYLILAVRRDATPVPFRPVAVKAEAPAVPKSTGRKPSTQSQQILAVFDECGDRAETARRLGLTKDVVYQALYQNGRIQVRPELRR